MHMSIGSLTTGKLSLAPNRPIPSFSEPLRHLKERLLPCTSTLYNLYLTLIYLASRPLLRRYLSPILRTFKPSLSSIHSTFAPLPHHFAFLFLPLSSLKTLFSLLIVSSLPSNNTTITISPTN